MAIPALTRRQLEDPVFDREGPWPSTPREFFDRWTREQLVDEVLRLEELIFKQARQAECAWCHEVMPVEQAAAHTRACTFRPQPGRAVG